ncbi:redoxin family protein [Bordetella petrii]|nr:redoxin family protein [Bordetella petrii]
MAIAIDTALPDGTLMELAAAADGSVQVIEHRVGELARGKRVALFAVPGAFTRTCSARHLPGFIAQASAFLAKGVDEIWCVSVNDAHVMAAWGRQHGVPAAMRMLGDGACRWTHSLGLAVDLGDKGMGWRSRRYSAYVVDGVVRKLNVEAPGEFAVSDAATLLEQI